MTRVRCTSAPALPTPVAGGHAVHGHLDAFCGGAGSAPRAAHGLLTSRPTGLAVALNAPFSEEVVRGGLQLLRNGRSAGNSGLPAELLRYALGLAPSPDEPPPNVLVPAITAVLNCWFRTGVVPAAANISLITPIHKRGDATELGNYRPIAVGEPLLRLFAALLNARLVAYTVSMGLRAPMQAGFRPGLSTVHQIFALQHLVDHARLHKQPLFCCFLDLKGAYDRVPRRVLWTALQRLGVHGQMLAAVQALYAHAQYAIHVGGRRGVSVESSCGVKQGCPLSPTLFGLLLDGLHWALLDGAPGAAPQLCCGRPVPDLGYADDFCLLGTSPAHLQRLLDVAHAFLTGVAMELSVDKTKVLVFGASPGNASAWTARRGAAWAAVPPAAWTCGGLLLERVAEYKYLGVVFSAVAGIGQAAFTRLRGQLFASWERLREQFGNLHDGLSFALHRAMFQQSVPSAGSYACEAWGLRRLRGPAIQAREQVAQSHVQLWRRLLRVRSGVAGAFVLRELGVLSPDTLWLRGAARFWNTLVAAPAGSLHRAVAMSDWADAVDARVQNWAWSLHRTLCDLGYHLPLERQHMPPLDVHAVLALHAIREQHSWEGLELNPHTCASARAHHCKYLRWFALPADTARNAFLRLHSFRISRRVLQFRIGCHKIPIVAGQHQRPSVPRAARLCLHCNMDALGDEYHVLYECPATRAARAPFAHLFPPGCVMLEFMNHADTRAVERMNE